METLHQTGSWTGLCTAQDFELVGQQRAQAGDGYPGIHPHPQLFTSHVLDQPCPRNSLYKTQGENWSCGYRVLLENRHSLSSREKEIHKGWGWKMRDTDWKCSPAIQAMNLCSSSHLCKAHFLSLKTRITAASSSGPQQRLVHVSS